MFSLICGKFWLTDDKRFLYEVKLLLFFFFFWKYSGIQSCTDKRREAQIFITHIVCSVVAVEQGDDCWGCPSSQGKRFPPEVTRKGLGLSLMSYKLKYRHGSKAGSWISHARQGLANSVLPQHFSNHFGKKMKFQLSVRTAVKSNKASWTVGATPARSFNTDSLLVPGGAGKLWGEVNFCVKCTLLARFNYIR